MIFQERWGRIYKNGGTKIFAADTPQGISAANIFIFPRVLHSLIK